MRGGQGGYSHKKGEPNFPVHKNAGIASHQTRRAWDTDHESNDPLRQNWRFTLPNVCLLATPVYPIALLQHI